jgi:hypothetical protein
MVPFWNMGQQQIPEEGNRHVFAYLKFIQCSE